ncbi:MAG: exo-alpha-sialidase [Armatimonadetes bacterium]|nr:exo-alpha-sialidase [Armatimonadota bacterium]
MTVIAGSVRGEGLPLGGVGVSDGYRVVRTDARGEFALPVDARSGRFVYVTTPAGWWTDQFYRRIDAGEAPQFELERRADVTHYGLYLTDLHLEGLSRGSLAKFAADLETINRLDPPPHFVVFGGDICLEGGVGPAYVEQLARLRVSARQAVGNHDVCVPDADPFAAFESLFGPRYHSFDVGAVHYVVLCGMVTAPENEGWKQVLGHFDERELHWLAEDLAAKEAGRPVVAFVHVPLAGTYCARRGTANVENPWWVVDNADEVLELLSAHDTRLVLMGHMHENERLRAGGIELVETVSLCGRWWSRAMPRDIGVSGEPRGWRRIDAAGGRITHRAVAWNLDPAGAAFTLPDRVVTVGRPLEVWVNVFDGDEQTRATVRADGGEPVAAEPRPYAGGIFQDAFAWVHHWRAVVDSAAWPLGSRHRLAAEIELDGERLELEQEVNVVTEGLVRKRVVTDKGANQWNGIPSVELSPSGTLWVACFTGGTHEPHPENRIVTVTSADGGATWNAPVVRVDPPGRTRAYDPCLFTACDGKLWMFYNLANDETGQHDLWCMVNEHPDNPASTFGEPRRIDLPVPYAFRINKPTVTSWGEWLLPVTYAREPLHDWFHSAAHRQGAAISGDCGASWTLHGEVDAPPWALENMLVERRDGSLWMLMRTGAGALWESVSTDRGRTWSTARPTSIVNPGSRFFIRRLRSGRLLLINSPRANARTELVAQLSEDDGATWSPPLMLDERENVSYPDAVEATDGRVFAVHDRERGGCGEVVLSVFREEDVPR